MIDPSVQGTTSLLVELDAPMPGGPRVGTYCLSLGSDGGVSAESLVLRTASGQEETLLQSDARAGGRAVDVTGQSVPLGFNAHLILDEPTSNVDSDTERRLLQAMPALTAGRSALVIAHRLSSVRFADRIACLHRGRIVEQGTHDELLASGGLYARLCRLQEEQDKLEAALAADAAP